MARRRTRWVLMMAASALGAAAFAAFAFWGLADVSEAVAKYPVVRYAGPGKDPLVRFAHARPAGWVALGEVSGEALGAVLVSEDWAFFEHRGLDYRQIRESIGTNWKTGRYARGASTITQQVARNLFLGRGKTLWRKVREAALAFSLERNLGKRRILEIYLNIAEWGDGVVGISQASRAYFGKPPMSLTAKEGAFLAMLLPNPRLYSQSFRRGKLTPYAAGSVERILQKMAQAGLISQAQAEEEMAVPLSFEIAAVVPSAAFEPEPPAPADE